MVGDGVGVGGVQKCILGMCDGGWVDGGCVMVDDVMVNTFLFLMVGEWLG